MSSRPLTINVVGPSTDDQIHHIISGHINHLRSSYKLEVDDYSNDFRLRFKMNDRSYIIDYDEVKVNGLNKILCDLHEVIEGSELFEMKSKCKPDHCHRLLDTKILFERYSIIKIFNAIRILLSMDAKKPIK